MDNELGARIRTLRKDRGLSQEALAQALEVSRQAVTSGRTARRCRARRISSRSRAFSVFRSQS
mgnify:CR=1 FL=1